MRQAGIGDRSGPEQLEAAADACRRAAAANPRSATPHFDLGVILGQQGKLDAAAASYRRALDLKPDYPEAWVNLGSIHRSLGRSDEAVAAFRQAIALRPAYPLAFYNLGNALRRHGQLRDAVEAYRQAIALEPAYAEVHHNLAVALRDLGAVEDAIQAFERAAALMPGRAEIHVNLARLHKLQGRSDAAVAALAQAVALRPHDPPTLYELGIALHDQGEFDRAAAAFQGAAALAPAYAEAHYGLGVALQAQGQVEAAAEAYRRAIAARPDYGAAHNNLGVALRDQGRFDDAVAAHRRAIALQPDDAQAHFNLGAALQDQGRLDDAATAYLQAVALKPDLAQAHYNLALQASIDPAAPRAALIAAQIRGRTGAVDASKPAERSILLFAMARTLEAEGDWDGAFACLTEANALHRASLSFDVAPAEARVAAIAAVFDEGLFERIEPVGAASERPIFIVGLPRSGTSLVEQILSAHPQVHGAGEIATLAKAIAAVGGPDGRVYPAWAEPTIRDNARSIGQAYLDALPLGAPGQTRITDKMLANFHHVGLIHLALPHARIVHCRRDPRDVCVSAFATRFGEGWEHAYDLDDLGRYWRAYERLMRHWTKVLPPGRMLEVPYEAVVADVEGWARALIAHCGLAWDDACLRFHDSQRAVLTTSFAQVRQPIYAGSVGRWRRFERHLEPLLRALGEPWSDPTYDAAAARQAQQRTAEL